MHVCISKFYVLEGEPAEIIRAFGDRARLVDGAAGFVSFWAGQSARDAREFVIEVRFRSAAEFEAWNHSHQFKQAHAAIPAGVKLDRTRTSVSTYEVITE